MKPTLLFVLVLVVSTNFVFSAKVLLVPANINSHYIFFGRLAAGLADHGHSTSLLAASNAKLPDWLHGKAEILIYQVGEEISYAHSQEINQLMVELAMAESFWERMSLLEDVDLAFSRGSNRDCEYVMDDRALLKKVEKASYDLVIMDMNNLYCLYNLPYKLNIPYAHLAIPYLPWTYGVPSLPSFTPNILFEYSERMSFAERLQNALMEIFSYLILVVNESSEYSKRYVPEKPPMTVLKFIANASLYFYLRDPSLGYPSPVMPNTIEIGDIMAQPAKALPLDLEEYMNQSMEGVILVSFGSYFNHMPTGMALQLCEAFQKIPEKIIWKVMKVPESCILSPNVRVMEWIPQNDLLAHPHLKAFVTHGGINSVIEAVYHEVPMVVVPIAIDQPYNAAVVQNKGLGLRMHMFSFTTAELVNNLQTVTQSDSIAANLKLHSAVLRNKPQKAAERASFWVDHVTKYGSQHLRTGAMELSAAQFFMVDIFLFVFVVVLMLLFILIGCTCIAFKCVKHPCVKNPEKMKQN